jgi:large subunit ribosomal protein L13
MKTRRTRASEIQKDWYLVDAKDKPLGRLATQVARLLMGKHKTYYEPFLDTGDFVIVINSDKVYVQEKKRTQKFYYRHTRYPGGLKSTSLADMLVTKPDEVVRKAVKGMLPKTRLGRQMIKKLKVYAGDSHPHDAQNPQPLAL